MLERRLHPRGSPLVRQLALAKLRELRRVGWSYRDIGRRYGEYLPAARRHLRLGPERLLTAGHRQPPPIATEDHSLFLRALDAIDHGLAFFDDGGTLRHVNRTLRESLERRAEAERLRREIQHMANTVTGLVRIRAFGSQDVETLAITDLVLEGDGYQLKGSFIGLDLFGAGSSILVALERAIADPLALDALERRFRLSRQEARIARLLVSGITNAAIAKELCISPHTARHHTERVLRKVGAHTRTEAVSRILLKTGS